MRLLVVQSFRPLLRAALLLPFEGVEWGCAREGPTLPESLYQKSHLEVERRVSAPVGVVSEEGRKILADKHFQSRGGAEKFGRQTFPVH